MTWTSEVYDISQPEPVFSVLEQPQTLYRMDSRGLRFYFDLEMGEPRFYVSETSLLKATRPESFGLSEWKKNAEPGEADRVSFERQQFGTFLHIQMAQMLNLWYGYDPPSEYLIDDMSQKVDAHIKEHAVWHADPLQWVRDGKKGIVAIAQFAQDRRIEPLAIEIVLASNEGHAGAIDLVCEMDAKDYTEKTPPSKRKRVRAIIDLKSRTSGKFYDSDILQLWLYKRVWEENFPDRPIQQIWNLSPKDWNSEPGYHLRDQTGKNALAEEIPHLIELWNISGQAPKEVINIHGSLERDGDLTANYETVQPHQIAKRAREKSL